MDYKKIFDRAKAAYGTGAYDDATLEFIFPELAESEDERMWHKLMDHLDWHSNNRLTHEECDELCAWLEKQKYDRMKPIYDARESFESALEKAWNDYHNGYENVDKLEDDYVECAHAKGFREGYLFGIEKQKEQKPAEWGEEDEKIIESINMVFDMCAANNIATEETTLYKLRAWLKCLRPQPKQEWSDDYREEDIQTRFAFYTYKDDPSVLYLSNVFVEEASRNHGFGSKILRAAEKVAETIGAITIRLKVKQDSPANTWYRKNGYGYVAFEDGYDWLEKNLEYLKPNKPEWSEEDEENFKWFDKFFRAESILIDGKDIPQDKYLWFKSLRPQPNTVSVENATKFGNLEYERGVKDGIQHAENHQWKPTEEQMEALKCAILDVARFSKRGGRQVEFENEPYYMALHSLYEHLKKSYSI